VGKELFLKEEEGIKVREGAGRIWKESGPWIVERKSVRSTENGDEKGDLGREGAGQERENPAIVVLVAGCEILSRKGGEKTKKGLWSEPAALDCKQ